MRTSRQAASGNTLSKVLFCLGAMLLVFAPPTARLGSAQTTAQTEGDAEVTNPSNPFSFCRGYFALCAASTCTPIPNKTIQVNNTVTGGTRPFPQADCTCPVILGTSVANLNGGNMQGSCEPSGRDHIWSSYQLRPDIPQAITDWVPHLPEAKAPPLLCPKSPVLKNRYVQCFSFNCEMETWTKNVPVVTCHCAIGASLEGSPVPPGSAFLTQAGQGDEKICREFPVGGSPPTSPTLQ